MTDRLRFTLLGHPVGHSISPSICGAAFSALNLPHTYGVVDIPSEVELRRSLDDLRNGVLAGANVTLPYKRSVLQMADVRAPSAEEVGAANVLTVDRKKRVIAHNTDAEALAAELVANWAGRPKFRALVIGAGGAGLAAIVACKRMGFKVICITSRSWADSEQMFASPSAERARALTALTSLWPKTADDRPSTKASQVLRLQWRELAIQADCIIQATSAGMSGADPGEDICHVVPWDRLPRHTLVYDVVYTPRLTPFLRKAEEHGVRAVGGLGMLVRQAQLSVRLWTGEQPPFDVMRDAAEAAFSPTEARPKAEAKGEVDKAAARSGGSDER
jgi:shikimate dehydrogenase